MRNAGVKLATQDAPDIRPRAHGVDSTDGPIRTAALVAGGGILLMAAVSAFGVFAVLGQLVVEGDASATAAAISGSEGLFRLGVASLYLIVVLDVVVAWALRTVFRPVSDGMSTLAAWFRLAYSAVLLVAVSSLAEGPTLLTSPGGLTEAQVEAEVMMRIDSFDTVWMAGLMLFGLHLLLVGTLAFSSGYVPRALGVLLVIAGVGYAYDTVGTLLVQDAPTVSTVTFLGEFLLALWLVVRGPRLTTAAAQPR